MSWTTAAVFLIVLQASVAGEWTALLTAPLGEMNFKMLIVQNGVKLSGHVSSEDGEFPLKGTVKGDGVQIEWSFPDGGRIVAATFTGKIEGNVMSGSARLGNVGDGPMTPNCPSIHFLIMGLTYPAGSTLSGSGRTLK